MRPLWNCFGQSEIGKYPVRRVPWNARRRHPSRRMAEENDGGLQHYFRAAAMARLTAVPVTATSGTRQANKARVFGWKTV